MEEGGGGKGCASRREKKNYNWMLLEFIMETWEGDFLPRLNSRSSCDAKKKVGCPRDQGRYRMEEPPRRGRRRKKEEDRRGGKSGSHPRRGAKERTL